MVIEPFFIRFLRGRDVNDAEPDTARGANNRKRLYCDRKFCTTVTSRTCRLSGSNTRIFTWMPRRG